MPRKKHIARWEGRLGVWPHVVWYGERLEKGGVCYTREWMPTRQNWKWTSCRMKVRDARGAIDPEAQAQVIEFAKRRHDLLTGKLSVRSADDLPPVTLGETWALLTGEGGRFPNKTTYRDELRAGIDQAVRVLGADFAWMHLDDTAFTRVIRDKVRAARARRAADGTSLGYSGYRVGVQAGTSMIIILNILKGMKRVPANVVGPGTNRWREDLKQYVTELQGGIEPEPKRPRHTADEMRALLAAAPKVDPRFDLLMALGAELRLGQVRRARRSSIDAEKGIFRAPGRRHKHGAIVELTTGQRIAVSRALAGYLAPLEQSLPDYSLFPQGRLITVDGQLVATVEAHGEAEPVGKRTINDWFRACELIAQVPHMRGRGAYGLRRRAVDEALTEGISPDALKEHGGWLSDRMPQTIYRDQNREKARAEARDVRARIRGENVAESYPDTETEHTS